MKRYALYILAFLTICHCLSLGNKAQSGRIDDERVEARKAWESLIRAKGGRERISSLNSILVQDFNLKQNKERPVRTVLHVLPNKIWEFNHDIEGVPFISVVDGSEPETSSDYADDRIRYLLETKYDKPEPIRVTRQTIGKEKFDVIEAMFRNCQFDFFYEPEEMLVKRLVMHFEKGGIFQTWAFDNYKEINGIKMPTEVALKSSGRWRVDFAFNVDYDPELFTRPQKAKTVDGWKRKSE